ncbi:unnamed protein product [Citrullus colocynthis]|uniref:Phytosulfokine n=1 Tax=Citrullus colocynthis TaxID=252529 RepID=A0ABP0Y0L9_9ROSI
MSKLPALFAIAALVTMSLIILPSSEARPIATFSAISLIPTNPAVSQEAITHNDGSCEGRDKEDCLIRRTLEAHIDYIYTSDQIKP